MFSGEYSQNLDAKNRIIIPAKLRTDLGESFVVTRGMENTISIYTMDKWDALNKKLSKLSVTKKSHRLLTRFFLSGANETSVDKTGRILVPKSLKEFANLEKECIFIGVGDHIELWSKDAWENYMNDNLDEFDDVIEEIGDIDF